MNDVIDNTDTNTPKPVNKSTVKNYIWNLIHQIFLLLIPIVVTPYVARVLTNDGTGKYSYVSSIVTYFTLVASMGFGHYAQRLVAKHQGDLVQQSKDFWEIIIVRLIPVFFSLLIFYIMTSLNVYGDTYNILMWILSIDVIAIAFDVTFYFKGNEEFSKIVTRTIAIKIISIIAIYVFVKTREDLWKYTLIQGTSTFISNLTLWFYMPKYLKKVHIRDLKPIQHFLPSLILFLPSIATSIYTVLDKTLIGALIKGTVVVIDKDGNEIVKNVSDIENGNYEYAEKIVKMALAFITSLGTVFIPKNSKKYADGDIVGLKNNISKSCTFVFFLGIPICLGLICVSNNIIPWYLGEGYDKAANLIKILSPIILFIGFSNVFGLQFLVPTGKDKTYTTCIVIGAVINLVLNCILIGNLKSYGAALSTVVAEGIIAFVMYLFIRKFVSLKAIFYESWKYFLAGAIMFVPCFFMGQYLESSIINSVLIVIVGVLIYGFTLLLLRDNFLINFIIQHKKLFCINIEKREIGIDLLHSMACVGVVLLHTVYKEQSILNQILYYIGVLAIPLFFMINGYLMLRKEKITYKYILNKILKLIIFTLFWCIIFYFAFSIYNKDFISYLRVFYLWTIQKGETNIFWFIATLIIIYIMLPLFKKVYENDKLLISSIIVLLVVNVTINILCLVFKSQIEEIIPQTFRLYTWLLYYFIGGFIAKYKIKILDFLSLKANIIIFILTFIAIVSASLLLSKFYFENHHSQYYYSYILCCLACFSLFILALRVNYKKEWLKQSICVFSSLTMGIFGVHQLVVSMVTILFRKINFVQWYSAYVLFISVIVISSAIIFLMKKVPLVKKYFC